MSEIEKEAALDLKARIDHGWNYLTGNPRVITHKVPIMEDTDELRLKYEIVIQHARMLQDFIDKLPMNVCTECKLAMKPVNQPRCMACNINHLNETKRTS